MEKSIVLSVEETLSARPPAAPSPLQHFVSCVVDDALPYVELRNIVFFFLLG